MHYAQGIRFDFVGLMCSINYILMKLVSLVCGLMSRYFLDRKMLNLPIHEADDLYKHGLALLEKAFPLKLRLMGLRYLAQGCF